jgi:hypothetical protein
MMIDLQVAFDNVHRDTLLTTLQEFGLPSTAIRWVYHFNTGRTASKLVEDKLEPAKQIETGIPQGSPISLLLFLLYTTPLYERVKELGDIIIGYVDDLTIYCHGKPAQTVPLLEKILQACVDWAATRHTSIDLGPKLGFINFTRSTIPFGRLRLRLPSGK